MRTGILPLIPCLALAAGCLGARVSPNPLAIGRESVVRAVSCLHVGMAVSDVCRVLALHGIDESYMTHMVVSRGSSTRFYNLSCGVLVLRCSVPSGLFEPGPSDHVLESVSLEYRAGRTEVLSLGRVPRVPSG